MYSLKDLAQIIRAEIVGNPDAVIHKARPFDLAGEGDVTFASGAAYRARLEDSKATAIILASPVEKSSRNLLIARNPKLAFARAVKALHARPYEPRGVSGDLIAGEETVIGDCLSIYPRVTIGRETIIGDRVTLFPGVVIGDRCRIGDDTVIHANVSVYDDTFIGSRVIIHAGTVIGADGFGFVPDEEGRQVRMLHLGRVRIEDDCEIGANCSIDRGGFGDTTLRRGVKLDNLIQVGHNTEIGEHTVIAALSGFSGGTRIGKRCLIAGQVGTREHITIGDGAIITARTAVMKSVPGGAAVGGLVPTQDYNASVRSQVIYSKLPELAARLRRLERAVYRREPGEATGGEEKRRES